MTATPTPARPAPVDPGAPPMRIPLRRRWMLRRQGTRDGRMRRPDPLHLVEPAATPTRALLHAEFAEAAAIVHAEFTASTAAHRTAAELARVRRPQLTADLQIAERDLEESDQDAPDETADEPPERRMGEHFQPDELIRSRRRREHQATSNAPRRRRDALRAELHRTEQEIVTCESRIAEARKRAADEVRRLHGICEREHALYVRALLRRHPEGDLLRDLLDVTPPPLPGWLTAAESRPDEEPS
jgi:hypothetical protein